MPIIERLEATEYLPDVYARASDRWEEFKSSGHLQEHHQTIEILCNGLTRLKEDSTFWASLHDVSTGIEENDRGIESVLRDLDRFFLIEEDILKSVNMSQAAVTRLLADLSLALTLYRQQPTGAAIENFRARLAAIQDAICRAQELLIPVRPRSLGLSRLFRAFRFTHTALFFVGCGVVITVNLTAVGLDIVDAWTSVTTGLNLISTFRE
jgi:hypothetical protein